MGGFKLLKRTKDKGSSKASTGKSSASASSSFLSRWKKPAAVPKQYDAMDEDPLMGRTLHLLEKKRKKKTIHQPVEAPEPTHSSPKKRHFYSSSSPAPRKERTPTKTHANNRHTNKRKNGNQASSTLPSEGMNHIGKFAATTALIANTFSDETRSTQSSDNDLYQMKDHPFEMEMHDALHPFHRKIQRSNDYDDDDGVEQYSPDFHLNTDDGVRTKKPKKRTYTRASKAASSSPAPQPPNKQQKYSGFKTATSPSDLVPYYRTSSKQPSPANRSASSFPASNTRRMPASSGAQGTVDPRFSGEVKAGGLPPFSVSGSMVCNSVGKKSAKSSTDSKTTTKTTKTTKTTRNKMMSPPRPHSLPPNTIMASMVCRTLEWEEKSQQQQPREKKDKVLLLGNGGKQDTIIPQKIVSAYDEMADDHRERRVVDDDRNNQEDYEDGVDENFGAYCMEEYDQYDDSETDDSSGVPQNIRDRDSCAQSSVSSVTMYSSYNHDPMVRASRNLLDILRSNRFEEFAGGGDHMSTLYEA